MCDSMRSVADQNKKSEQILGRFPFLSAVSGPTSQFLI